MPIAPSVSPLLSDGEQSDALDLVWDLVGPDTDGRHDGSGRPHRGGWELVTHMQPHRSKVGRHPAGEDRGDPIEDIVGRILARETVPELGEHLIGRRTLAVHDAVGEPLCPATGRLD